MTVGDVSGLLRLAEPGDLGEIQTLQWACFDPVLREPLDVLAEDVLGDTSFVLRVGGRLVGMIRCQLLDEGTVWHLGLLMVAPDLRGRGPGRHLLAYAEAAAPPSVTTYALFTGADKADNLRMYKKAGYRNHGERPDVPGVVRFSKPRRTKR